MFGQKITAIGPCSFVEVENDMIMPCSGFATLTFLKLTGFLKGWVYMLGFSFLPGLAFSGAMLLVFRECTIGIKSMFLKCELCSDNCVVLGYWR